ncbi:MAG: NfeD family protein [candidate division KSB1 bacterium]|jgi:membrane protein implicated in regulation of membrane protease activity|nr:NfeD family protein [candidate division KSB1 bacterium]
MHIEPWYIWMIVAAILIVGEIFTAGFFILWFGVAAAVAGMLALLGLNAAWQWGAFVIVSGVLLAFSRKLADKFSKEQPKGIGADRFIGQTGVVLEEIDNTKNSGRVRLGKEEWRAESYDGVNIRKGETVEVTRLEGTHLIVKINTEEV